MDNDYFAKVRDEVLLSNVEKYHLGPENFWKLYKSGQYTVAIEDLKFVLRYYPNHPETLQLLGSIARLTHDSSLPIPYYEKALRLYPQYASTHAQYGAYLVDVGLIDAGIARLKHAIEMDSKLALAHAWLANAYYQNGNQELARQAAERARALGYKGNIPGQGPEK